MRVSSGRQNPLHKILTKLAIALAVGPLLRLLASRRTGSASNVASYIRGLVGLAHNSLDSIPRRANRGRGTLVGDCGVNPSGGMGDRTLDEGALRVTGSEESQVDEKQNPASLGEGEGRQNEAEEKAQLQGGHKVHTAVVVLLDKLANGLSKRRLLSGRAGRAWGGRATSILRRLQRRQHVSAGVRGYMEDRVHAEGQQSQRNLAGVQPNQRHSCRAYMSRGFAEEIGVAGEERTEVLNILVTKQFDRNLRDRSRQLASSDVLFVYNNAVGSRGSDKSQTIGDLGRARIVIEGDIGDTVPHNRQEEGQVAANTSATRYAAGITPIDRNREGLVPLQQGNQPRTRNHGLRSIIESGIRTLQTSRI
jgi:hypothetical protein